ncbi:hypothetical protein AB6D11_00870 [Vibrio splendidus]
MTPTKQFSKALKALKLAMPNYEARCYNHSKPRTRRDPRWDSGPEMTKGVASHLVHTLVHAEDRYGCHPDIKSEYVYKYPQIGFTFLVGDDNVWRIKVGVSPANSVKTLRYSVPIEVNCLNEYLMKLTEQQAWEPLALLEMITAQLLEGAPSTLSDTIQHESVIEANLLQHEQTQWQHRFDQAHAVVITATEQAKAACDNHAQYRKALDNSVEVQNVKDLEEKLDLARKAKQAKMLELQAEHKTEVQYHACIPLYTETACQAINDLLIVTNDAPVRHECLPYFTQELGQLLDLMQGIESDAMKRTLNPTRTLGVLPYILSEKISKLKLNALIERYNDKRTDHHRTD